MIKSGILFVCALFLAANVNGGNFPQDFQEALALYNNGKIADAEVAFIKLSEQNVTPHATDESLRYSAYCAVKQKNADRAMELAGKIKDKYLNMLCRMHIFSMQYKAADIVELSKDEDFEKWPDYLIYDALTCRGSAYAKCNNTGTAEKDFLASLKYNNNNYWKALVYLKLGNLYGDVKEIQKALDAYGEVFKLTTDNNFVSKAAISRAKLIALQGNGEQALAELDRIKDINKQPYSSMTQLCYGEIYESLGKKDEALSCYKAVASSENVPEDLLNTANEKIGAVNCKDKK